MGVIRWIQNHVITVGLGLEDFETWLSAQSRPGNTEPSSINFGVINSWTFQLNGCLTTLASILQQSTRLQSLRIEARPARHDPLLGLQRRNYLMALPLASLVSISHLTCLDIDTAGTHLIGQSNTSRIHLCDKIRTILSTFRRLRCRLGSICPHIFDVSGKGPLLSLEDVVINLSLSEISGSATSYRYPSRCVCVPGDSFPQSKADMEFHVREVVHEMNNPQIARIVSHTFPGLDMRLFDSTTGRQMVLSSAAPWDANGEEVEGRATAEDLFDSDSSPEEFLLQSLGSVLHKMTHLQHRAVY